MIDEDEQVLQSDGQAVAQLWVLASEEPPAGGKQKISHTDRLSSPPPPPPPPPGLNCSCKKNVGL